MSLIDEFEERYEKSICNNINTIVSCLNDGDVFIDIGANTGLLSYKILERVKLSKAILIEPIKRYYDECLMKFNDVDSVEVENIGFSDVNGVNKFICSEKNFAYNKIYNETMEIHPHFVEMVHCVRFSDWVGDRTIDFIKIDAEGHDTNIINGMVDWLNVVEKKPYILFEGEWYEDLEDNTVKMLMRNYQYNVTYIGRDILMTPKSNKLI